jgi:uncharacterized membrane protein
VEQELPPLPEHLSSPSVFSGVRVTRSFVLCVMFCRSLFVLLAILLSVFTERNELFILYYLFILAANSLANIPLLYKYCADSFDHCPETC